MIAGKFGFTEKHSFPHRPLVDCSFATKKGKEHGLIRDCGGSLSCPHHLALHEALVPAYRAFPERFGFVFHSGCLCYLFSNLCCSRIHLVDMGSLSSGGLGLGADRRERALNRYSEKTKNPAPRWEPGALCYLTRQDGLQSIFSGQPISDTSGEMRLPFVRARPEASSSNPHRNNRAPACHPSLHLRQGERFKF